MKPPFLLFLQEIVIYHVELLLFFMYNLFFKRKLYVFSVVLKIHGLPTASYWYHAVLKNKSLFGLEFLD